MLQKLVSEADRQKQSKARLASYALMLGNFVVGLCILAPTGMLRELADGLNVTIRDAGLLVTFGAVVLCVGSPLMAWATSRLDRRMLLAGTLAIVAIGNVASALAPNYAVLLGLRLLMMAVAVVYTPQAAGTIALIVPEKDRSSAVAFVFVGWTLSIAAGLPLVTFLAAHIGWREAYLVLGAAAALIFVLLVAGLPAGLRGAAISFRSWSLIAHSRTVILLLLITVFMACGSFAVFTYFGPLLSKLAGAGPQQIAIFFAIFGVMGFIGNMVATRIVRALGVFTTSLLSLLSMFLGTLIWSAGAGAIIVMGFAMVPWGLGFAAANSMQQARLIAAAPELASATVALNTSSIYVGQALGSGIGGILFARGLDLPIGYVAITSLGAALLVLAFTRSAPALRITK